MSDCADCSLPADVEIFAKSFCAEHYRRRVANMRRNADKLIFDKGVFREPTGAEKESRQKMDCAYMTHKTQSDAEKWKQNAEQLRNNLGMKKAADYAQDK